MKTVRVLSYSLFGVVVILTLSHCQFVSRITSGALNPSGANGSASTGTTSTAFGPASVYQYHKQSSRTGVYVDPLFTKAAAANLHVDPNFSAPINGPIYAQPLFLDGNGARDILIVATEQNDVIALDASTGSVIWDKSLGTPMPLSSLPCGNINTLGITGTPVIDPTSRTIYVAAMTTPDGGTTAKHLVFALSADDGSVRTGWPLDVSSVVKSGSTSFTSSVQNQRGALLLLGQTLYVPYGGHFGDCGDYHGWVVGIPVSNPSGATGFATGAVEGGIWAPSGVASDGTSIFVATGNTGGTSTWAQGEAILRLSAALSFSGLNQDFYSPTNWQSLDNSDEDLGGSGVILFSVPGATPSNLALGLGKDGNAYLVNSANLGGISDPMVLSNVSSTRIITASTAYTTPSASYVAFNNEGSVGCPGATGELMSLKISATSPPKISVAWCAPQNGRGSPITTTVDGTTQSIVWSIGAENDNRLHGFDGDTGAVVFAGGGTAEQMGTVQHFQTPIAAKGHIYVSGNSKIYSFTLQ
jgi:hypothetical protein